MNIAKIILDTNIVSYVMKSAKVGKDYEPHLQGKLLSISFIIVGELYYGAEKANWGEQRRKQLETALRNYVVIPYDHEIARCYGKVAAERKRNGMPISLHDAWIAASAVRHAVPLVTHNPKDFFGISGLQVITEYKKEG